eukprot:289304-Amorphochlora_amoeboformis.AAC.2
MWSFRPGIAVSMPSRFNATTPPLIMSKKAMCTRSLLSSESSNLDFIWLSSDRFSTSSTDKGVMLFESSFSVPETAGELCLDWFRDRIGIDTSLPSSWTTISGLRYLRSIAAFLSTVGAPERYVVFLWANQDCQFTR